LGAIHAAVLILAARYLADDSWIERVKPFDETETVEATTYIPGMLSTLLNNILDNTHASHRLWRSDEV
jgi:hypothetical protein